MTLSAGTKLGPYEIVAPIGAGGMGEVYRATDSRLGRDVAIKVLPEAFAADKERLARFEQEARAASALSHPNILTVFDVGAASGQSYIAMELVEGRSLRELLDGEPLSLRKGLDISAQIAEGLAKAHGAGIVHRDLKPENVMISKDGFVKILDFGLAKLSEPVREGVSHLETAAPATTPGTVMGTVGYMSPEQASGKSADYRSDQFSFGAIGYEMATGKKAFGRNTSAESMAAIIRDEPEAISTINPKVPAPVRWIIERCLAKDPEERFASTKDLARDLKSIRDHLSEATAASGSLPAARGRRPRVALAAASAAVGALVFLLAGLYLGGRFRKSSTPVYRRMTFQKGFIFSGRFVPGGGTAVYSAAWDGNRTRLFTVRAESPESSALPQPDASILAISSSGEMAIALASHIIDGFIPEGTLARVPFSGGAPREVMEKVQWADWTPDGSGLAVVRDEAGQNRLEFPIGKVLFRTAGWVSHIRFSPKGDRIAFVDHPARFDDGGSVDVVDLTGRSRKLSEGWATVQGLAWSSDGSEVWFSAAKEGVARSIFAVTEGKRERLVARAPGTMTLLDVARDGRVLMSDDRFRNALVVHAAGRADRDLSLLDYSTLRDLSRDGSLVLFDESGQGGGPNYSVYIRKTDGSPAVRLGDGSASALSPDSAWVAATTAGYPRQLVLLPTRTGQARALPVDSLDHARVSFFPDGKRIAFTGVEAEKPARLFVQDLSGGKPKPISPEGVGQARAMISPDGRLLAAQAPDKSLRLYEADGGASRPIAGSLEGDWPASWSGDGRFLYVYRRAELPLRIYRIELASGRRELWKEIVPSDPSGYQDVGGFSLSADASVYAYVYYLQYSDLYQLEGLK